MATDDKDPEASEVPTPSQVLATELPNVRGRQGLSAEDLAARVRLHGGKLDRAAISKIENDMRGVSLDEAIMLGYVLGVSPIHLFLPRDDDVFVARVDTGHDAGEGPGRPGVPHRDSGQRVGCDERTSRAGEG
jgi:transcriptional regulator with XRE-family HTH domain